MVNKAVLLYGRTVTENSTILTTYKLYTKTGKRKCEININASKSITEQLQYKLDPV